MPTKTLQVTAELANLASLRNFAAEAATAYHADPETIEDIIQAVDEAATNIIVHGYQGQSGSIELRVGLKKNELVVVLRDQAPLFDPTQVPPPDLTLPLEQRPLGGLGIFLARQFVDSITYRVAEDGSNELTLRKKIRGGNR